VRWVVLLAFAPLLGCGSNKGTSSVTAPTTLTGTWIYSAGSLASLAGGYTCAATGFTLTLIQSDASLTGSYKAGTIICNGTQITPGSGAIADGTLTGSSVAFDFDNTQWHNEGTSNPSSMSGNANVQLTIAGTLYNLTGTWTASRK
jgi:hypothetical protein